MPKDVVVAPSKFVVPRIPNATITRHRLLTRLDEAADRPLTLISAPPGYGKTALLAQWANRPGARVAWMSCDAQDQDPQRFWRSVTATLDATFTGAGLVGPEPDDDRAADRVALGLLRELGQAGAEGALVLDDFHETRVPPDAMLALVAALPESVRLVLGSRADPAFPLGRIRVQGRMLELRQADLRFSAGEIGQVLDSLDCRLAPAELGKLDELTEGWPAGVQLAALWLRSRPDRAALLQGLAESDRSLVDFLMTEVIDLQPPEVSSFLLRTAELDAFDADLCDAATGAAGSAAMLDRIRAANLFLVETDGPGAWYRYHRLFQDFLRARHRQLDPGAAASVHRAVAAAYERRGDSIGAIRHTVAAGDVDLALDMLQAYGSRVQTFEDRDLAVETVRTWLQDRTVDRVRDDTDRVLVSTVVLASMGATGEADLWLQRVRAHADSLDHEGRFLLAAASSFCALHLGDPRTALHEGGRAERLRAEAPIRNSWAPALPIPLAQARLWLDDFDRASAVIDASRRDPDTSVMMLRVRLDGLAALVAAVRGELTDAERLATLTMTAADDLGLDELNVGRSDAQLVLGGLHLERNRLDEAQACLEHAMRIVENNRRPPIELLTRLEFATLAAARGDEAGADEHLDQARRVFPLDTPEVAGRIAHTALAIALAGGQLATAEQLAATMPPGPRHQLGQARLALARHDAAGALDHLGDTGPLPGPRLQLEHLLLRALGRRDADRSGALHDLAAAVALAEPLGYQRTVVDEGAEVWKLLEALPAVGRQARYVQQLLAIAYAVVPPERATSRQLLIDPLTERELTVLRHLASRLDSTEIAAALYVSANTVRSHVKAIYRKLGVSSRSEAVTTGRSLGLF